MAAERGRKYQHLYSLDYYAPDAVIMKLECYLQKLFVSRALGLLPAALKQDVMLRRPCHQSSDLGLDLLIQQERAGFWAVTSCTGPLPRFRLNASPTSPPNTIVGMCEHPRPTWSEVWSIFLTLFPYLQLRPEELALWVTKLAQSMHDRLSQVTLGNGIHWNCDLKPASPSELLRKVLCPETLPRITLEDGTRRFYNCSPEALVACPVLAARQAFEVSFCRPLDDSEDNVVTQLRLAVSQWLEEPRNQSASFWKKKKTKMSLRSRLE